jgi:hypothetical protein
MPALSFAGPGSNESKKQRPLSKHTKSSRSKPLPFPAVAYDAEYDIPEHPIDLSCKGKIVGNDTERLYNASEGPVSGSIKITPCGGDFDWFEDYCRVLDTGFTPRSRRSYHNNGCSIKIAKPRTPSREEVWFSQMIHFDYPDVFELPSDLNGNNGSWTNTDDMANAANPPRAVFAPGLQCIVCAVALRDRRQGNHPEACFFFQCQHHHSCFSCVTIQAHTNWGNGANNIGELNCPGCRRLTRIPIALVHPHYAYYQNPLHVVPPIVGGRFVGVAAPVPPPVGVPAFVPVALPPVAIAANVVVNAAPLAAVNPIPAPPPPGGLPPPAPPVAPPVPPPPPPPYPWDDPNQVYNTSFVILTTNDHSTMGAKSRIKSWVTYMIANPVGVMFTRFFFMLGLIFATVIVPDPSDLLVAIMVWAGSFNVTVLLITKCIVFILLPLLALAYASKDCFLVVLGVGIASIGLFCWKFPTVIMNFLFILIGTLSAFSGCVELYDAWLYGSLYENFRRRVLLLNPRGQFPGNPLYTGMHPSPQTFYGEASRTYEEVEIYPHIAKYMVSCVGGSDAVLPRHVLSRVLKHAPLSDQYIAHNTAMYVSQQVDIMRRREARTMGTIERSAEEQRYF